MPEDAVNHPKHYNAHPSGVECITVTRHMSFNLGNAIKYLWRADEKGAPVQDLRKAIWYIEDEIKTREHAPDPAPRPVVAASVAREQRAALEAIANGTGHYGEQAREYKNIARKALGMDLLP